MSVVIAQCAVAFLFREKNFKITTYRVFKVILEFYFMKNSVLPNV